MRKLICFLIILINCNVAFASDVPQIRPDTEQYCFDFTDTLSGDLKHEINFEGRKLKRAFDIDFLVVMVPTLNGRDVLNYTVDLFSEWEVGKSTKGKKGLMILIALEEQKVRVEVGYDLEAIYTDAYVGQVEREILKEFLELGDWDKGFLATIESFLYRLYNKDLTEEVKAIESPDDQLEFYSEGAGATNVFDFGAAVNRPLPDNYLQLREYFSAQPTPEAAFLRYMDLAANAVKHNNDFTLFTDLSNKFWKIWSHTSGQLKAEARDNAGKDYFVRQRGNYAVVFFPGEGDDQKKITLYFLSKSDKGWQVDINTMARTLRYYGPNWLRMIEYYQPYTPIIMKEYNNVWGYFQSWDNPKAYLHFASDRSGDGLGPGFRIKIMEHYTGVSNLQAGDRVLEVDGSTIKGWKHFYDIFGKAMIGDRFRIKILRDGKKLEVTETLTKTADGYAPYYQKYLKVPRTWIGVYLIEGLDLEWRHTLKLRDQGMFQTSSMCFVMDVAPGSPADKAGLKPADLILYYGAPDNNGEINSIDVVRHLSTVKPGESLEFTVLRNMKDKVKLTVITEQVWHKEYF